MESKVAGGGVHFAREWAEEEIRFLQRQWADQALIEGRYNPKAVPQYRIERVDLDGLIAWVVIEEVKV